MALIKAKKGTIANIHATATGLSYAFGEMAVGVGLGAMIYVPVITCLCTGRETKFVFGAKRAIAGGIAGLTAATAFPVEQIVESIHEVADGIVDFVVDVLFEETDD